MMTDADKILMRRMAIAYALGALVAATGLLWMCLGLGLRPSTETFIEAGAFGYYVATVIATVALGIAAFARLV